MNHTLSILPLLGLPGLLLAATSSTPARRPEPGVSATRCARLARGINLPRWFWLGSSDLNTVATYLTNTDFALIHSLDLTHVRVPIDLEFLFDPTSPDLLNAERLAVFDQALAQILSHNLAVVVDLHSTAPHDATSAIFSGRLEENPAFVDTFIQFWSSLAAHLSPTDPDRVFLEPMNEPVFFSDPSRWPPIQKKLLPAIRASAPQHTLLATGALWSSVSTLVALEPLDDPNIIYNFHFYEPHTFTHQGAGWGPALAVDLRSVPYPVTPTGIEQALALAPHDDARRTIETYQREGWNKAKLDEMIGQAAAWGRQHGVRLTCNEFGAYKPYTVPADRAQWIRDVRTLLEQYQIGWAMWDYDDSFGLVERQNGQITVDETIAGALGLRSVEG